MQSLACTSALVNIGLAPFLSEITRRQNTSEFQR